MKIHDNMDEPKVNGYILGDQNHVGFYFNGYVYYFGFSAYKAYPRKTHLQNWCKKWVYLNEMCAEKKRRVYGSDGWNWRHQEIIRLEREVDKGDMIIGKLLNEGKAATEKNKQLRQLLKECKEYLSDVDTYFTKNADEATLLLTRIKKVLK